MNFAESSCQNILVTLPMFTETTLPPKPFAGVLNEDQTSQGQSIFLALSDSS